jgi:hypothetical protein
MAELSGSWGADAALHQMVRHDPEKASPMGVAVREPFFSDDLFQRCTERD